MNKDKKNAKEMKLKKKNVQNYKFKKKSCKKLNKSKKNRNETKVEVNKSLTKIDLKIIKSNK